MPNLVVSCLQGWACHSFNLCVRNHTLIAKASFRDLQISHGGVPESHADNRKRMPAPYFLSHRAVRINIALHGSASFRSRLRRETRGLSSLAPALAKQPQEEEEQVDDVNVDGNRSLGSAKRHFVSLR